MSVGNVLLGILAREPAHGYDLKREHDESLPQTKPLAYGQVYATLGRLERDGLIEVAEVNSDGGPERTVYAITDAGRAHLSGWLDAVEPPGPYPADDLVRKTVTALKVGADANGYLSRQRAAHLARMRELVGAQRTNPDPAARVVLDHTVAHLDADLRWLEAAADRVGIHQESR